MDPNSQISAVSDPNSFGPLPSPMENVPRLSRDFSLSDFTEAAIHPKELDVLKANFGVLRGDLDQPRETCTENGAEIQVIKQELESIM